MNDTKSILVAARDHLATVGLHKGSLFADHSNRDTSPCCGLGAIDRVVGSDTGWLARFDAAADAWIDATPDGSDLYGDAPDTTLGDVLNVFDQAIAAQP